MSLQADRQVTRNAAALFTGRALVMALSFAFLLGAARLLGVTGFGRYALVRMYFDLLLGLSVTGLAILITREIARTPSSAPVYLVTAAPLVVGLTLILGGSLTVVSPLMGYGPDIRALLWLACAALVPASLALLSEAVFVATGKAHYVMWGTFGEALLYTGSGLLLLRLGYDGHSLFTLLLATRTTLAVAYSVLLRQQFGYLYRPAPRTFTTQLCRDWRVFAFENWLAQLTAAIGPIVLSISQSEGAVGLYSAASKITHFGAPLMTCFTSAMFPFMSRLQGESAQALQRISEVSLKYMLALAFPGVVIVAIFADQVILTLYGEAYADSIPVLRIVIWAFVLNFVNPFVSHVLFARGEQTTSLRVGAVTFVFSFGLSMVLAPRWGAIGTACAVLASTTLACCLFCAAAFRADPARVLITFGKATAAAASLAAFLAAWRHAHPAALMAGAFGVYVGALFLMRVSSAREVATFFRSSQ